MALFKIRWKRSAIKELRTLPQKAMLRILATVENLLENPRPINSIKLSGSEYSYRIRMGNYRIVYNVMDDIIIIEVIRIGHRKGVY
jgi:mRNA interferase RelE/StbE